MNFSIFCCGDQFILMVNNGCEYIDNKKISIKTNKKLTKRTNKISREPKIIKDSIKLFVKIVYLF